jgi:anti-sigma factor RsiW
MTCHEFEDDLHDYVDGTLPARAQQAAAEHAHGCPRCRNALQRAQALGHLLQQSLGSAAAPIAFSGAARQQMLARLQRELSPARTSRPSLWSWFTGSPLRTLGMAAAVVAIFAIDAKWSSPPAHRSATKMRLRGAPTVHSIDVPFQTDRQVGLSHAEFSSPPLP